MPILPELELVVETVNVMCKIVEFFFSDRRRGLDSGSVISHWIGSDWDLLAECSSIFDLRINWHLLCIFNLQNMCSLY
jgi:hypothetical protein